MNTKDIEELKKHCWVDKNGDYQMPVDEVQAIISEAWNEAIKECEGCVPGRREGRKGIIGTHYTEIEQRKGWNSCRNQTLQAINKLRV